MNTTPFDLFGDEVIDAYSRAQAMEDNFLRDITNEARACGWKIPAAMTTTLSNEIREAIRALGLAPVKEPIGPYEDGALFDLLEGANRHARKLVAAGVLSDRFSYDFPLRNIATRASRTIEVRFHIGPGDDPAPVLTLMLPGES